LFHAAAARGVLPFRALLLAEIAVPSRGRLLPCSSRPGLSPDASRRTSSLRVSPTPTRGSRGGLDPHRRFGRRFHRGDASAPTISPTTSTLRAIIRRDELTGFVCFEAFIPPRSRTAVPAKRRPRPLLSWASAPPEPCSDRASDPRDPADRSVRRGLAFRDDEECESSPTGEADTTSRPPRPRGRPARGATSDRHVPPLGGNPASLDLQRRWVNRRRLVLGGVKHSISDPSPKDGLLSWGFLPPRRPRDFARRAGPGS
jgi:hypothetical protein